MKFLGAPTRKKIKKTAFISRRGFAELLLHLFYSSPRSQRPCPTLYLPCLPGAAWRGLQQQTRNDCRALDLRAPCGLQGGGGEFFRIMGFFLVFGGKTGSGMPVTRARRLPHSCVFFSLFHKILVLGRPFST